MSETDDKPLLTAIRAGDQDAWQSLIDLYEGRLIVFIDSRLRNRAVSEELVQETFLGFLISLPNYDERTPLESWLFSIAGHKLTDHFRKTGRRPTVQCAGTESRPGVTAIPGPERRASSLFRSGERKSAEADLIQETLKELIQGWKQQDDWQRLQCAELLFVVGQRNKEAAESIGISEQEVANHKSYVLTKLKEAAQQSKLPGFRLADFSVE
ncbi:RNA polymerase sigma factor [Planctomycetaceae bacterium]|jgi:RNA polymerase sigma-70 factor, ECF subfamily|nr:RNA polymerase sigma factor [Planctomycetaceae bacterium]MDC0273602.1 RNA polymerase sigma factor [Planctomycetaceae bacterium]MDG2390391.1 RNA polymerase sigma factor [Planctomycetaceae bacterium]